MLGDDRDTIPLLGDYGLSDSDLDDISIFLDAHLADTDLEGNTGSETPERPQLPPVQTTRAGRKKQITCPLSGLIEKNVITLLAFWCTRKKNLPQISIYLQYELYFHILGRKKIISKTETQEPVIFMGISMSNDFYTAQNFGIIR